MTVNSFRSLLAFGALYSATQGALDSWDEAYEMLYLTRCGCSIGTIAIAQTLSFLPMAFKSLLSVPSDLTRLRRPFVFGGLVLSACCFFMQLIENAASTRGFVLYVFFIMLRNTGAGISDCAGDGLIIDADVEPLSGTISAYQGIGRMAGLIVSTIIGQQLADRFGFEAVLVELGFWMLLTAPVAAIVREELEASPLGRRVNAAIKRVADALTCGGRLGAVLGALGFGWLTDRLGRRKLFFITLALYLAATAATSS